MHSYEELTSAERELWDAYPTGRVVDFRTGEPEDHPENGHGWGADRTIRATVVAALLLGAHPGQPGTAPALRLKGARIGGTLDLGSTEIGHGLWFEECWFEHSVNFSGAATRTISIAGSLVPGIDLTLARVEGRVALRDTVVRGRTALLNARVAGELILSGATLSQPGDWALFAGGLVVDGGFFCRGATVHGGMRLLGAQLSGGLHMQRARLHRPGAFALLADNATVRTLVLSDGFTAQGAISLRGAQIADRLTFDGVVLDAPGTALDCTQLRTGALDFTPAEPPSGPVDLRGAHALTVRDRTDAWPGIVHLQGFTYGSLTEDDGARPNSAGERVAWIRRNPGYASQPYEQLATWYRQIGRDDDARRVLLARQRHRRRTLSRPARAWGHLLDASVGYGYRPWLAGVWLAALALFGTAVFSTHAPHPTQPGQVPPFHAFVYTLDLLIPIGGLGQRSSWYWTGATAWLSYALVAAGWLLTTAVLAGISRTLNKN
ncbi:oxidoreductase [Streptomyces sp. NPDC020800]|uniref:oxidoreductase n=1 Tax=Streptomyces sp. NPDC020800 TaxID=3365092 RepID=UPI0037B30D4C